MRKKVAFINTFANSPEGSLSYQRGEIQEDFTDNGRMDRLYEDNQLFIKELKKYFDVVIYDDLRETGERIEYAFELEGPFNFIITNVPFNKEMYHELGKEIRYHMSSKQEQCRVAYRETYEALDKIHKFLLKKSPKTKIIANNVHCVDELKKMLKKCHVSHIIYWVETKHPLFAAWRDKLKNLIVDKPQRIDSLIERFINKIDAEQRLSDDERSFISKEVSESIDLTISGIENIIISDKGFTSKKGFEFKNLFIKIDLASRLERELSFYGKDLGMFNQFRPKAHADKFESSDEDNIGILAMDNVKLYAPGIEKAKKMFGIEFKNYGIMYNLFLMSLFHKESAIYKDKFDQLQYEGVHGLPHFEESSQPFFNIDGEGLKRFEETKLEKFGVLSVITAYLTLQKEKAKSIIHGDWKDDNIVNGHLVDYAMVGKGFEVDELAYYLSDAKFNCGLEDFHRCIDDYIKLRSLHDIEFKYKTKEGYGKEMHKLANSAFLSQLVLRHSVMNKRDMMDDNKFKQRQFYKHMIEKVVKGGRFI